MITSSAQIISSTVGLNGSITNDPGSPANSVQFNNAGAFAGDANLTWNSGTHTLTVASVKINSNVGFFAGTPAAKQTVTGVKLPSDTVMASLLAALVAYGLITDSTT